LLPFLFATQLLFADRIHREAAGNAPDASELVALVAPSITVTVFAPEFAT